MNTLTLMKKNLNKKYISRDDNYAEITLLITDFNEFRVISKSNVLWFEDDKQNELLWLNVNGSTNIRIANNEMRFKFIYRDKEVYYGVCFNKDNYILFLYSEIKSVRILTDRRIFDMVTNVKYIQEFFIQQLNGEIK
jgi:hypothetical protein